MQRLPKTTAWASKVTGDLLLAKVKQITTVGVEKRICLKVKVQQNNFHAYSRLFYVTSRDEWSLDPDSKIGDVVLIRRAPEQHRPISHVPYTVEKSRFGAKEFEREAELRSGLVSEMFSQPLAEEGDDDTSEEQQRVRRKVAERRQKKGGLFGQKREENLEEEI
uniref:Nucleic acid-binding protein n=1 Tax=Globodera pallida TaxID=36090 RepID=A0A183C241_GLOPA